MEPHKVMVFEPSRPSARILDGTIAINQNSQYNSIIKLISVFRDVQLSYVGDVSRMYRTYVGRINPTAMINNPNDTKKNRRKG